jgi:hypothetical protein
MLTAATLFTALFVAIVSLLTIWAMQMQVLATRCPSVLSIGRLIVSVELGDVPGTTTTTVAWI